MGITPKTPPPPKSAPDPNNTNNFKTIFREYNNDIYIQRIQLAFYFSVLIILMLRKINILKVLKIKMILNFLKMQFMTKVSSCW